jgi:2-oxoisovalerate dehydrogenase E1 component alpha subunit
MESPASRIYPGDKEIHFTSEMDTHAPHTDYMPIFRMMNEDATFRDGTEDPGLDRDTLIEMYTTMGRLQTMDQVFMDAQRQGRISFYMQNAGEEGAHIGSAMALSKDDMIFAQYREAGVLMWRGFSLQQFADQCFSNEADLGKGRQMPVHYGSRELNFQTISSPLTTQLPQAVGAAYAMKLAGEERCAVVYFGDGAASEGDFHAAMNFAATLEAPCIFFCRNNGFAISTPVVDQYAGDGIAARGLAYGMHTIRVDGNDVFAVRAATMEARRIAVEEGKPCLIEAMTYREGHHSTSDDSTRYRSPEEIATWHETSNPVVRLRTYLEGKGWWDEEKEAAMRASERKAVLKAMAAAEGKGKPGREELFNDVYDEIPAHLLAQKAELEEHIAKYPDSYTSMH